jgi:uncharacterized protein YeaO (DUF488 family)
MAIRIVRLGSPRGKGEGLRIGTVRRPPRGVPKHEFASRNFYDVWLPNLAPSEALLKRALQAEDARAWRSFVRSFRMEMKRPEASRVPLPPLDPERVVRRKGSTPGLSPSLAGAYALCVSAAP